MPHPDALHSSYANVDRNINGFSRNQPKDTISVHLHGCMKISANVMNKNNRRSEKAGTEQNRKKAQSERELDSRHSLKREIQADHALRQPVSGRK